MTKKQKRHVNKNKHKSKNNHGSQHPFVATLALLSVSSGANLDLGRRPQLAMSPSAPWLSVALLAAAVRCGQAALVQLQPPALVGQSHHSMSHYWLVGAEQH